ncbi:MAG: hypothetical protein ACNYVW_03435, partial [Methanosarcinales archaeon]
MTNMDRKNAIIAVLSILLVLSIATSVLVYQQQQRVIAAQEDIIEQLTSVRSAGRAAIEAKQTYINVSKGVSCANIVAVRTDNQFGVLGTVHVELKNGTGNVLVNTNPFTDLTTQYSVREAVKVAEDYTNRDVTTKDISIYFNINGTLIGGPSAGAAIAAAAIAAMEGKTLKPDVVI